MAVTYAWRLDSNKFAYIVPPYDLDDSIYPDNTDTYKDFEKYGFLSETPLTDYFLRAVSTTAESKFGKNGTQGLSGYTEAFAAMQRKITLAATDKYEQLCKGLPSTSKETFSGWTGMEKADLLSADVYYNVDSEDCADLRGVGIKGTRYLGSIPGDAATDGSISSANLENMTYIPSGSSATTYTWVLNRTTNKWEKSIVDVPVVQPGIPGFVDVYGIYLTDNLEDNDTVETTNQTPEYMFVIRNGGYGPQGPQGDPLVITDDIRASLTTKSEFNALSGTVSTLETAVDSLTNSIEDLTDAYNIISLDGINSLSVMVSNLQKQLSRLEQYLFGFELPDVSTDTDDGGLPSGGGSGKIEIVPLGIIMNGENGGIVNDYTDNDNKGDGAIEGWGEEEKVNNKVFHLLGYLEDPEDYLTTDGENRIMPTVTRLYSLPNIAVSLTGITFGMGKEMQMLVNGNTYMNGSAHITGNTFITGKTTMGGDFFPNNVSASTVVATNMSINGQIDANKGVFNDTVHANNGFYQASATTITPPTFSKPDPVPINSIGSFSDEPGDF